MGILGKNEKDVEHYYSPTKKGSCFCFFFNTEPLLWHTLDFFFVSRPNPSTSSWRTAGRSNPNLPVDDGEALLLVRKAARLFFFCSLFFGVLLFGCLKKQVFLFFVFAFCFF